MSSIPGRFSRLRWIMMLACLVTVAAALTLALLGALDVAITSRGWTVIAAVGLGSLGLIVAAVAPLLLKVESTTTRQLGELRDLNRALADQGRFLADIAENTRISDAAKSLTHREQELDALRRAIQEEVRAEHWESALSLVAAVEHRFGYRQEAERQREELEQARQGAIQTKLAAAVEMIERHFELREWERADREIDRLMHVLPGNDTATALRARLRELKQTQKLDLKRQWEDALRRNDTDQAIDVLKELDPYLTASEAQSLQESARTVFKEKLLQLGVQFRFAVSEKRWQDALSTGLDLIREFPNARMASEVRDVLDTLRDRARQALARRN